nr:MAG TPA: hypothetical protein [Caudoviricetes sp.]
MLARISANRNAQILLKKYSKNLEKRLDILPIGRYNIDS